jgi:hypothetical protein
MALDISNRTPRYHVRETYEPTGQWCWVFSTYDLEEAQWYANQFIAGLRNLRYVYSIDVE